MSYERAMAHTPVLKQSSYQLVDVLLTEFIPDIGGHRSLSDVIDRVKNAPDGVNKTNVRVSAFNEEIRGGRKGKRGW